MRIRIVIVGFFVCLLGVAGISYAQDNNSIKLGRFSADIEADSSFLEQEAGISAYGQVSYVDLNLAENAFKNVEKKTPEYIIGSVALSDYPESDDVHVYVDISGWIIAYYLYSENASKIIDWKGYSGGMITGTKLEEALQKVAAEMGSFVPEITYYDFRYADATHIMVVTDETSISSTETFKIMIPSPGYLIYDRTWSHAMHYARCCTGDQNGSIAIDGVELHSVLAGGWGIWDGVIPAVLLSPNVFHEVSLYNNKSNYDSFVGIVMIYKQVN